LSETFLVLSRTEQDTIKIYIGLNVEYPDSRPILFKLEFGGYIFEKYSNIKFNENPYSGSRVVPCVQTDGRSNMTKLIVAFRNFATGPKNTCCEFRMMLVPLLYSKVSIQMCAVMIDFTCLHSHDAFYLRATSLDVRLWGF